MNLDKIIEDAIKYENILKAMIELERKFRIAYRDEKEDISKIFMLKQKGDNIALPLDGIEAILFHCFLNNFSFEDSREIVKQYLEKTRPKDLSKEQEYDASISTLIHLYSIIVHNRHEFKILKEAFYNIDDKLTKAEERIKELESQNNNLRNLL